MRIRRDSDNMLEEEIVLLAKVSDALAHPVRIKIFQFIMKNNATLTLVCNKDVVANFDYAQATAFKNSDQIRVGRSSEKG